MCMWSLLVCDSSHHAELQTGGVMFYFCMTTRWHCSEQQMRNCKRLSTHVHTFCTQHPAGSSHIPQHYQMFCSELNNSVQWPHSILHNRPVCHEAQWTNTVWLVLSSGRDRKVCVNVHGEWGCIILSELPITISVKTSPTRLAGEWKLADSQEQKHTC